MSIIQQTLIIAEAGVNHNGDLNVAKKLVDAASKAGADVVKFQTFKSDHLVTECANLSEYQRKALNVTEKQLDMLGRLELLPDQHSVLIDYCNYKNIEFLSSPFDSSSIQLLDTLNLKRWKIPSGEITNLPYLREIGAKGQPVILSTGMASLGEIESALAILEQAGTLRSQITVLHCTTEYPAPIEDVNLRAMNTIAQSFGVSVGYSDHTKGITVPIAAVAMGATVIEKHLTLDCSMDGPDHKSSLEPDQFAAMVSGIRTIEKALGDGIKRVTSSEYKNITLARKSIVASSEIKKGQILSSSNITAKRPGTGISPMRIDELIGSRAVKDYKVNEPIVFDISLLSNDNDAPI